MRKLAVSVTAVAVVLLMAGAVSGEEPAVAREELDALKGRLDRLEEEGRPQVSPLAGGDEERPWYEKLNLAVGATGVLQGSSGVRESLNAERDVTDGSVSCDVELSVPITEQTLFYSLFQSGTGDGLDGDLPTLSGFNADADSDSSVRLMELWYQQTWSGDHLRLRVGKVDLTTDFDTNAVANCETEQFLSGGFVNNLAVEFPDDNGPGAMLWVTPNERWALGLGVADADADGEGLFADLFSMVEVGYKPQIGGRQGSYRLYGWLNHGDHEDLTDPTRSTESNRGFGLSCDQEVGRNLTLFARGGWQRDRVSVVQCAWSAGLQYTGRICGREGDALGLAYGVAVLGDAWRASEELANPGDEHHLELYYRRQVNERLSVSPDLQWVRNANGDRDNGQVWSFGVRTQLCF
jgi:carbohydrate-selective porin OprB